MYNNGINLFILVFLILLNLQANCQSSAVEVLIKTADEFAWHGLNRNSDSFFLNCGTIDNKSFLTTTYNCSLHLSCEQYKKTSGDQLATAEAFGNKIIRPQIVDSNSVELELLDRNLNPYRNIIMNFDSLYNLSISKIRVIDNRIYLLGYAVKDNSSKDLLIVETDTGLSSVKYFSPTVEGKNELISDVTVTSEGIFLATKDFLGPPEGTLGGEVVQLDTALTKVQKIWDKEIPFMSRMDLHKLGKGKFIITGQRWFSQGPTNSFHKLSVGMLNLKGDSIELKSILNFGKENISTQVAFFGSTLVGEYLYFAGTSDFEASNPFYRNNTNEIILNKIKVGEDTLEKVWTKYYKIPDFYLYLTGISRLQDSTILLHGSAFDYFNHPENLRNAFLMKIDYNGEQVQYNLVEEVANEDRLIYPNPAKSFINFDLPGAGPSTINLYNTQGELMLRKELKQTRRLNISELPSSLYIYRLEHAEGRVATGKLVKE